MKLKTIVALLLIVLMLIILFQNVQVVTIRFLVWKISMSRIIFTPLIFGIGFTLGYFFARIKKQGI